MQSPILPIVYPHPSSPWILLSICLEYEISSRTHHNDWSENLRRLTPARFPDKEQLRLYNSYHHCWMESEDNKTLTEIFLPVHFCYEMTSTCFESTVDVYRIDVGLYRNNFESKQTQIVNLTVLLKFNVSPA